MERNNSNRDSGFYEQLLEVQTLSEQSRLCSPIQIPWDTITPYLNQQQHADKPSALGNNPGDSLDSNSHIHHPSLSSFPPTAIKPQLNIDTGVDVSKQFLQLSAGPVSSYPVDDQALTDEITFAPLLFKDSSVSNETSPDTTFPSHDFNATRGLMAVPQETTNHHLQTTADQWNQSYQKFSNGNLPTSESSSVGFGSAAHSLYPPNSRYSLDKNPTSHVRQPDISHDSSLIFSVPINRPIVPMTPVHHQQNTMLNQQMAQYKPPSKPATSREDKQCSYCGLRYSQGCNGGYRGGQCRWKLAQKQ